MSEPAYHLNNTFLYRVFKLIHKLTPERFETALFIFVRKFDR